MNYIIDSSFILWNTWGMAQANQQMSEDTKIIIVVLLLLFVYPVGLVVMWLWMKEWPTWAKLLISLPVAMVMLLILFIILAVVLGISVGGIGHLTGSYANPSPSAYVQTTPVLGSAEEKQMFAAARVYVKQNSVPNMEFNLDLVKVVNDQYALLKVVALNVETDQAMVIMEKVNGVWQAQTMGTDFPNWQQKIPQLFN